MEAAGVESKGSPGDAADPTSKKVRRTSWGCAFILVNNCFQSAAYFGLSTNLVNYLKVQLHSGSKAAANSVTNWQGTSGIAPPAAAFLADSFLGRYWTITLFVLVSVAGYGVVTASAWAALESAVFYAGLYLVGLGGALQPVMASFGADQFDVEADDEERGRQSSFFNWFYLSLTVGSLVGGTVLVVVAAARKCDVETPTDAALLHERDGDDGMSEILGSRRLAHTNQFRSLDKAAVETPGDKARPVSPWRLCTVTQVEELKDELSLDYFFWLLAMLCVGNFGGYLLVTRWYNYKKTAD
uniref:Peptide transporter PTR1 n=1 Tax=Aegilops tauschii TaxID=37682 RepID=M8CK62_AEGTA